LGLEKAACAGIGGVVQGRKTLFNIGKMKSTRRRNICSHISS